MIVQYDGKKEAKRLERWSKIAKEAAEQSHRCRVPAIEPVRAWRELKEAIPTFDLALFCYERKAMRQRGKGIRDAVLDWKKQAGDKVAEPKMPPSLVLKAALRNGKQTKLKRLVLLLLALASGYCGQKPQAS